MRVLLVTSEWPTEEAPNAVPAVTQQVAFLRRAGVHVEVYAFRGAASPLRYRTARRDVAAILRTGSFDLVHAHFGQAGVLVIPSSLPLVVTFHGSDLQGIVGSSGRYTLKGRLLRRVSRLVARAADEVIVIAESLAESLPRRTSFEIIPTSVDLAVFRPGSRERARRALGLPTERRLVLFSGQPGVPVKRFELARRAVELLEDAGVELIVAEDVPHEEMPTLMQAVDLLLVTSLHEGGPAMVKEALACNLPVVSVDVGDVRSLIAHLEGCVLCEEDSPATISRALKAILESRRRFNGRDAVSHVDADIVARRVLAVYERAVYERESAPAQK